MSTIVALRSLADLLMWANKDTGESWDYSTDAVDNSAYAEWVRTLSPEFVIGLIDIAEAARLLNQNATHASTGWAVTETDLVELSARLESVFDVQTDLGGRPDAEEVRGE